MTKPMKWTIIGLVIVFGGLVVFNTGRSILIKRFLANMPSPAVTISSVVTETQTWYSQIPAIGSLSAVQGVDISAELAGQVTAINFTSGETVEKGQSLIQLDDSLEQQDLRNAKATLDLAQLQFNRYSTLAERQASSELDLDKARSELEQAKANLDRIQTQIDKKNIKAPFEGQIGIRDVNLGQYVQPGEALVTLQAIDPLFVDFWLPAKALSNIKVGQPVLVTVDAYPDKKFEGTITAINAKVDKRTRNITIQALLPNDELFLYPGMFANINVVLPEQRDVITLPQTAVAYSLYGDSVFIIEEEGEGEDTILKASRKYITTGEERDNLITVLEGLEAGQQVVATGTLKVQDGTTVIVNNDIQLNPEARNETLY